MAFELGLEWAGLGKTIWQVEIDDYATKVLEKNFPGVNRFRDIRDCGAHNLDPVDLICGGFPCQPFSVAGKRRGAEDDRHLWPEYYRIVRELRPSFVLAENVYGIINMELDNVLSDLESEGYYNHEFQDGTKKIIPIIIPACGLDAKHKRNRVFILGHTEYWNGEREQKQEKYIEKSRRRISGKNTNVADSDSKTAGYGIDANETLLGNSTEKEKNKMQPGKCWSAEPDVGRVAYGVPSRVDRLKCLGNAVVPQVSYAIGMILKQWIEELAF